MIALDPRSPLALLASQLGAEVSVRLGAVSVWAEMRLRHPWRPADEAAAIAYAGADTPDEAVSELSEMLTTSTPGAVCVACGAPAGATIELPFVTGDGWPVSRRVCRPGAVCAVCRFGAREIES